MQGIERQSRSLLVDSAWLVLAATWLPRLGGHVLAAALTNTVRSFSTAGWAVWADRLSAGSLFLRMAFEVRTEAQLLSLGYTAVAFAAMMFRDGERVLHHAFHHAGFVTLALMGGRSLRWLAVHSALYWAGVFARASEAAAAAALAGELLADRGETCVKKKSVP